MPQTITSSNETQTPKSADGLAVGQSASDLVGFYGATPIAQPSGAAQAAVTDASGGTAAATNGILTLTGTYNSTILADAIATLAAQSNAIRNALVSVGIIKGSS
jgi:hypothetical protein